MSESTEQVPDDLMQKLHQASDHFHESKESLEKALDKPDFDRQQRVDTAEEELRKAEKEIEDAEEEIKKTLPGTP